MSARDEFVDGRLVSFAMFLDENLISGQEATAIADEIADMVCEEAEQHTEEISGRVEQ